MGRYGMDDQRRTKSVVTKGRDTHVGLDVEVLEVERVLSDIDTDDGDEAEERVLVGRSGDLEALSLGVVSLHLPLNHPFQISKQMRKTYEPTPSKTLNLQRGHVELLPEVIKRPECDVLEDAAGPLLAAAGGARFFRKGGRQRLGWVGVEVRARVREVQEEQNGRDVGQVDQISVSWTWTVYTLPLSSSAA
jgi:hypothetical protein